jgi:hypothetical protein
LALQQRRIALQAHSTAFGYIGSRTGWWLSEFKSQIKERDAGQLRAIKNLKRLISERGAMRRMARAVRDRHRHLTHVFGYFSLLVASSG